MRQSVQSCTLQSLPFTQVGSVSEAVKTLRAAGEIPFPLWIGYTKGKGRDHLIR